MNQIKRKYLAMRKLSALQYNKPIIDQPENKQFLKLWQQQENGK